MGHDLGAFFEEHLDFALIDHARNQAISEFRVAHEIAHRKERRHFVGLEGPGRLASDRTLPLIHALAFGARCSGHSLFGRLRWLGLSRRFRRRAPDGRAVIRDFWLGLRATIEMMRATRLALNLFYGIAHHRDDAMHEVQLALGAIRVNFCSGSRLLRAHFSSLVSVHVSRRWRFTGVLLLPDPSQQPERQLRALEFPSAHPMRRSG